MDSERPDIMFNCSVVDYCVHVLFLCISGINYRLTL